jgi:general nucleoside transport system ATP-binding protein
MNSEPGVPAVELLGITKHFPSSNVLANDDVSLAVAEGEVHALVGENGAGKTTLMNILFGLIEPDQGQVRVHGQEVRISHPDDAIRLGIGMVHQHFKLVPSFTVAENIMLGIEPNRLGFLQRRDENEQVRRLAEEFGLPVDPTARVGDLSVGQQQRVEILKILQRDARILVLDEPTAVLTPQEVRELVTIIRGLTARGRTIIFITHKLLEVIEVADRVSVMRRGKMVGTRNVAETDLPEMARMMVGREILFKVDKGPAQPGETVLQVDNLLVAATGGVVAVSDLSLSVRAGEILGIAGVSGNGQTELVEAITGLRPVEDGTIRLLGQDITELPVGARRDLGMAHIPEDRLSMGLNATTSRSSRAGA